MKVIIDIPEDMYNDIQKYLTDNSQCYALSDYELREVIRNGKSYKERPQGETQDKKIEAIIEELESRKDYGAEYAQAMEDVIVILKAQFGIK